MITKSELDLAVALELGEDTRNISLATELFLHKLMEHIATGEDVHLRGFGKFKLRKQGGAPPPHARFGNGETNSGDDQRYRVHFSKSVTFAREVRRHNTGEPHGKSQR